MNREVESRVKSLSRGHEHFGAAFVREFEARCADGGDRSIGDGSIYGSSVGLNGGSIGGVGSASDAVRTALELTAVSIVASIRDHVAAPPSAGLSVLLSGGGAKNPALVARLEALAPELRWLTTAEVGVDPDAKEAVGFAVLGYLTLAGGAGNTVATGARSTTVLGKICHPGPGKTIPAFQAL